MAESQVPYSYPPETARALRASISEPRFAPYYEKGGQKFDYAMALYLYNARLAKAFLFPLHVVEVTLRNAITEQFVADYNQNWHIEPKFVDGLLTPESRIAFDKAVERAGVGAPPGQIIAALTFDFWSNLLRPEYGNFWRTKLNIVFPHIDAGSTRRDIQQLARAVNRFRNRVAHHEPILDMNVIDISAKINRLVALRSQETEKWMRHHTTISAVLRRRPRSGTEQAALLAPKLDPEFLTVKSTTTLKRIVEITADPRAKGQPIVCVDDDGKSIGGFTPFELLRYISAASKQLDGMIDLGEHDVAGVMADKDAAGCFTLFRASDPLTAAIEELKKPSVRLLIGVDDARKPVGAIMRAHRRY